MKGEDFTGRTALTSLRGSGHLGIELGGATLPVFINAHRNNQTPPPPTETLR